MPEGNRLRAQDVEKYKQDIASGNAVDYPVVENGVVDNGNHRIEALRQSGETTTKVWDRQKAKPLTKAEAKAHAEGTAPETNKSAAPKDNAPTEKRVAERRQEEVPVEEERRAGPRRNAAGIRVDAQGNPELSPDLQAHWQSSAFGEKPVEDIGTKARQANPEPTRTETKGAAASLPAEEKPIPAKEPGLMKAGEEGREETTSGAEYHPAVQEQVFHLSNENLDKYARAKGIDPTAPEYSRSKEMRNEGRHQTGRQKLAEDVTNQLTDEEKVNIGRQAEGLEHNPDMANKTKAERAASLFPELRKGESPTYGAKNTGVTKASKDAAVKAFNDKATRSNAGFDPSMLADAAKVAAYHIEAGARSFADFSSKMVEDFGEKIRPYLKDLHTKASEDAASKPLDVLKHAGDYNKAEGLQKIAPEKVEKSPRAKEIADEYAAIKHAPNDPEVKKSYAALIDDVKKQWDYAKKKMGINIEPTDKDPYGFTGDKPAEKQLVDDVSETISTSVYGVEAMSFLLITH